MELFDPNGSLQQRLWNTPPPNPLLLDLLRAYPFFIYSQSKMLCLQPSIDCTPWTHIPFPQILFASQGPRQASYPLVLVFFRSMGPCARQCCPRGARLFSVKPHKRALFPAKERFSPCHFGQCGSGLKMTSTTRFLWYGFIPRLAWMYFSFRPPRRFPYWRPPTPFTQF